MLKIKAQQRRLLEYVVILLIQTSWSLLHDILSHLLQTQPQVLSSNPGMRSPGGCK